jgi:hypothetical protein
VGVIHSGEPYELPPGYDHTDDQYPVIVEEEREEAEDLEIDGWDDKGGDQADEGGRLVNLEPYVINMCLYDPEVPLASRPRLPTSPTLHDPPTKPRARQASCRVMYDLCRKSNQQEVALNLARAAIYDPSAAVRKQAFSTLALLADSQQSVEGRSLLFKPFLALLSAKRVLPSILPRAVRGSADILWLGNAISDTFL